MGTFQTRKPEATRQALYNRASCNRAARQGNIVQQWKSNAIAKV
ncbi:MAG: hypothetical protein WAL29_10180 [Bacteroidales bacterium]